MKIKNIVMLGMSVLLAATSLHAVKQAVTQKQNKFGQLMCNSLWGLGSASVAYLTQRFLGYQPNARTLSITLGVAGCTGFGLKYFYDYCAAPYTHEQLLNLLIDNPKKALDYTYKINEKFTSSLSENSSQKEILDAMERYEKDCPILSLGECVQEDWGHCILSRAYNSKFREQFETKVADVIAKKLKNQKVVKYAGFGSGGMFQDLVTIAKTLKNNPTSSLNINLIDPKYFCYMDMRDQLKNTREVGDAFDDTPTEKFLDYALEQAKKADQNYAPDPTVFKSNVATNTLCEGKKYREFIAFLKTMFPKATLSLFVHESTDAYLEYVEKNKLSYPDVIAAVDIEDEMSLIKQSTYDYGKLCFLSMQKKPTSTNLWLSKGKKNQEPEIVSYSLNQIDGATKQVLTTKLEYDNTIEQFWVQQQKI